MSESTFDVILCMQTATLVLLIVLLVQDGRKHGGERSQDRAPVTAEAPTTR